VANLNVVHLIGRLTRDVETRSFANGGKVAQIGFVVNNRKKNAKTGEWEDEPCWLNLKAFNRENGRNLADLCENHLSKGSQVYVEGHLLLEEWEDKQSGDKRSKLVIIVDDLQFLDPKRDGDTGRTAPSSRQAASPDDVPEDNGTEPIPF
jgi:single-strand DNA-binding protein